MKARIEEHEVPYQTLAKYGLTREMIEDLPMHVLEDIGQGRRSPVLPIQVEDENENVVKMTFEGKGYGLPNLKCFERLHANVVRRLGQNWEYTGKIYPNDIKEHIRYFINLCNKEGRGESAKPTSLKDVFVGNLSKDIEAELKEYYNAR